MKAFLSKVIVAGVIAIAAMSSVNAGWMCKVHNARGQSWTGTADSRAVASATAMKFCAKGSSYVSNCTIDYCNGGSAYPAGGTWQCNATNARGQLWTGTGSSRAVAASNAAGFCTAHSSYASNCKIKTCFIKY